MKTKFIIISISIIGFAVVMGYFVYFVSGVSSVLPPIKTYKYDGNTELIVSDLKSYERVNKHLSFDIIDTLGDKKNRFGYEIIVKYSRKSDTLRYDLKCIKGNPANVTIVKLIGAHNLNNNTGGYGLKVKGMGVLINDFNTYLVDSLRNRYGIVLKADNEN